MASGSPSPSLQEPIELFISARTKHERFVATGQLIQAENGWTIVFRGEEPDDILCLFTPPERSRFAGWVARHFPHWLTVLARQP